MNSRAQSIASDLLHMSASDLEEFLTDDTEEEKERLEQVSPYVCLFVFVLFCWFFFWGGKNVHVRG